MQLVLRGKILKESDSRSLQVSFDSKRSLLLVLSSENKLEIFKVVGSHKKETILKKLVKREKKASVKRTHSEREALESQDDSLPLKKTVDKAKLA